MVFCLKVSVIWNNSFALANVVVRVQRQQSLNLILDSDESRCLGDLFDDNSFVSCQFYSRVDLSISSFCQYTTNLITIGINIAIGIARWDLDIARRDILLYFGFQKL